MIALIATNRSVPAESGIPRIAEKNHAGIGMSDASRIETRGLVNPAHLTIHQIFRISE